MCERIIVVLLALVICGCDSIRVTSTKEELLEQLSASEIHQDDLRLIRASIDGLTVAQLQSIADFLTDPHVFADSYHFDVTPYQDWYQYNFERPAAIVALANLARRDLFLDPARQLNNRALTNLSAEALAALTFSQTYVEEKWDNTVPWDGDQNTVYKWIQPEVLNSPKWEDYVSGDFLYRERVRYRFATFEPGSLQELGEKDDIQAALWKIRAPVPNAPRLAGYSYPIGNQLYLQTAETLLWYADYLAISAERYDFSPSANLDTAIALPHDTQSILAATPPADWRYSDIPGLYGQLNAEFAEELRRELSHPESAAFWNVMRFVHAGARQREGGGSAERPGDTQPAIIALRYSERSALPQGRKPSDISAFALITTVYSDSILLDFTNWSPVAEELIVEPIDASRADGIHRRLSERNKAIHVVELMGHENDYSHAAHISGSHGLGLQLVSKYADSQGDFLPYTPEEAYFLVRAQALESIEFQILDSAHTLCQPPPLLTGYEHYVRQETSENKTDVAVETVCQD